MSLLKTEHEETMDEIWKGALKWREERITQLEAALNEARILIARVNVTWIHRDQLALDIGAYIARTTAETPVSTQDYKVQCRCGWMGNVSVLKSLPEFKMGCPDCSAEFVPLNKMTFPAIKA